MQTFPSKDILSIKNNFAAIETGNSTAAKKLSFVADKLNLLSFKVDGDKKALYHLAGVFSSNFFVGNIFSAHELFKKSEIIKINFNNLILPIINSTLHNIKKAGAENSLSGPVERGDLKTIQNHAATLKKHFKRSEDKTFILNYFVQSLSLINLIKKSCWKLNNRQRKVEKFLLQELRSYLK